VVCCTLYVQPRHVVCATDTLYVQPAWRAAQFVCYTVRLWSADGFVRPRRFTTQRVS
jgi:hypothetical protein